MPQLTYHQAGVEAGSMPNRPRVEPLPISTVDLDEERQFKSSPPDYSGSGWGATTGCLTFLTVGIIIDSFFKEYFNAGADIFLLLIAGVSALLGVFGKRVAEHKRRIHWERAESDRCRQREEEWNQYREREISKRIQGAEEEAAVTTKRIERIQEEARHLSKVPSQMVSTAKQELDLARRDFDKRVYGPFWDHIASASESLARFRLTMQKIADLGSEYRRILAGRDHSFPGQLGIPGRIASPKQAAERLLHLTREGQKDIQFAIIWEHHKTRWVIAKGISTLEGTLRDIGRDLQVSIARCAQEVALSIGEHSENVLLSDQVASQELVNGLIDIKETIQLEADNLRRGGR